MDLDLYLKKRDTSTGTKGTKFTKEKGDLVMKGINTEPEGVGVASFEITVGTNRDPLFKWSSGSEEVLDCLHFRSPGTPIRNIIAAFSGHGGGPQQYDIPT